MASSPLPRFMLTHSAKVKLIKTALESGAEVFVRLPGQRLDRAVVDARVVGSHVEVVHENCYFNIGDAVPFKTTNHQRTVPVPLW